VALSVALATVGGLDWPYDGDHFRDIAQAQTALQGHPLADPFYVGEWVWYNPLVPWLVALGAWLSGAAAPLVHVQGGPWFNLLGPVAFYVLGVRLAGHLAAFISLALLLFVNCDTAPSLTCATYSPWLFVASFAQGLFFAGVLVLDRAARSGSRPLAAAAGAVAGLTFLAHTGPALILGGMALLLLPPRSLVIADAAALVVASPFVWAIAVHYRLHVLNATPMAWSWPPLTIGGFPITLRENAVLLVAAAAGLFVIRNRVMYAWMGVAALLLALALARDIAPSIPALVPTFHFWRYVLAGATLLAGALAAAALERVVRGYALATIPLVLLAAVVALPHYRNRFDFVYGRGVAAARSRDLSSTAAFLRKSTPPDAVILGSRGLSLEVIGPAGRKVVGVTANWSNPYIDATPRIAARETLLRQVAAHDTGGFTALADAWQVTHAVGMGQEECTAMADVGLQPLYRFGEVCVFARGSKGVR
jgi:hypothetical protein